MENFREKYITQYLEKIENNKHLLTTWEKEFAANIRMRAKNKMVITRPQFNTLKEIAERF
jgi:hypothetical protein